MANHVHGRIWPYKRRTYEQIHSWVHVECFFTVYFDVSNVIFAGQNGNDTDSAKLDYNSCVYNGVTGEKKDIQWHYLKRRD